MSVRARLAELVAGRLRKADELEPLRAFEALSRDVDRAARAGWIRAGRVRLRSVPYDRGWGFRGP